MNETFMLTITTAGLDALVDAQNSETEQIQIAEIGLSAQQVVVSPTLVGLPGEFKRLAMVSGQSASETIIHMTAVDPSTEAYDVRSVALYLDDGTLFAAYSREEGNVFRKVDIATFLFSIDVAFSEAVGADIVFGDATFLYPPATEVTQGVAEIATQAEVDAETDDVRIVTPLKLAVRLAAVLAPVIQSVIDEETDRTAADNALQALVDALEAITITGAGLATGGGDLTANRVITVTEASGAEALAEVLNSKVLTPNTLAGFARLVAQNGYVTIPGTGGLIIQHGRFNANANGSTNVNWPTPFPNACYAAFCQGSLTDPAIQDNYVGFRAETITVNGATAYNGQAAHQASFMAIGR